MQLGPKFCLIAATGLTLAQVAATASLPPGFALAAATDVIEAAMLLVMLSAMGMNALASQGRLRTFWFLQMAGWTLWFIDQSWWILYDLILRKPIPAMFFGDVMVFLAGVPMLAGLLLRPNVLQSKQSVRLGMVDFLLLTLWWLYAYVFLVMCWKFAAPNAALYYRNFDLLYKAQALILIVVGGLLVYRSEGAWRRFYSYFLVALLFNSMSVISLNRALATGDYYNGCWRDVPFLASMAFFIIIPISGRHLTAQSVLSEDGRYRQWMERLAIMAVLSMPVIIFLLVSNNDMPEPIVHFRVLITAATIVAMFALVFVKQRRLHEELRDTNHTLEEACMTDPLTGVRNRRFFSAIIQGSVADTLRAHAASKDRNDCDLVFYLIDLDNFKEVNDVYGHDAGDRVLAEAADRIASAIRASDVLMRWGGEEFLVVSRRTNRRQADALATRILEAVRTEPYRVGPAQEIQRTCSVGWAAFPWLEEQVNELGYEEVLNMADRALQQAKRSGKDQAIGMSPQLAAAHAARHSEPQESLDAAPL